MRRQYTVLESFIASLPYIIMVVVGGMTIASCFGTIPWVLYGALLYVAYGVTGAVWIMIFMCPSCNYYGTWECPCGYGIISSKLVKQQDHERFSTSFRKHIPFIVPIWFIPLVCGAVSLYMTFSWTTLALLLVFMVNSYVVLPVVAKKHSCAECPQKEECPWMAV
jgi:hypothetical protein